MIERNKTIDYLQIGLILVFISVPLFVQLPFKINLFLAWEGAYRLSIGQIPFKDFSLPMGFGFWLIPAVFFKIFGPAMITLLKAQAFINLIGALAFRSILRKLDVEPAVVFLSLLVFCISFVFVNFWPWYNNSVFIFELIAINFLISYFFHDQTKKRIVYLCLTSFFLALSFFTKQDGGALAIITATVLLMYDAWAQRSVKWFFIYIAICIVTFSIFILPFLSYGFLYWFNVGQAPHSSRVNVNDILTDIFEGSQWIKAYLVAWLIIIVINFQRNKHFIRNRKAIFFSLFTFCILIQAMLVQVTSYIPHNVNIYFHSIAFAFIIASASLTLKIEKTWVLALLSLAILFWWSADYWRYGQRIVERVSPGLLSSNRTHDQVSKYTWFVTADTIKTTPIRWKASQYASFKNILLPEGTIAGIDSIMKLPVIKKNDLRVLNMSELTPLAIEIGFVPLTNQPLWFHKNVSMFEKEINAICLNISNKYYDLVLFEVIPNLNEFYPHEVRESLVKNYRLINTFQAPRDNATNVIEVYLKD